MTPAKKTSRKAKAAYTRGPWIAIDRLVAKKGFGLIADCERVTSNFSQQCANARLIAAAPDLYTLAKQSLAALERYARGMDAGLAKDLRAAIARVNACAKTERGGK